MIHRILDALQQHSVLLGQYNLESLSTWEGKVQTDHRLLKAGDIFVCIKGESFDGHTVINDARSNGAAIVVGSNDSPDTFPYIKVTDTRKAAAIIARNIMLPETLPYKLIGITGTNGKTTTSQIIFESLRILGYNCGWIGTLGYYINNEKYLTQHTTPDIVQLNTIFAQMVEAGVSYIVMEVSSHALSLDRVYGVRFDFCLFSNLSRDHLDFHGDMNSYGAAKYKFFAQGIQDKAISIINIDDDFGKEIAERISSHNGQCKTVGRNSIVYRGQGSMRIDYQIDDIKTAIDHTTLCLHLPHIDSVFQNMDETYQDNSLVRLSSKLIGSFNVQNLALMAATLHQMGFSVKEIERAAMEVMPITGRFESIPNEHGLGVYVDYAHTPDAIENILKSAISLLPVSSAPQSDKNEINTNNHSRIITVFGAGGERDKGKRPLMLKAALKYSDVVIVTDDNPRFENPEAIIRDIVIDSDPRLPWWIIRDRKLAIESAIKLALPNDLVIICGKGHEEYQEVEGVRRSFSDRETAKEALNKLDSYFGDVDRKSHQVMLNKADDELVLPVDRTMLNLLFIKEWQPESSGYQQPQSYKYLSTDSRNIKPGSLFFAIKGERFDGHNYLSEVLHDPTNCAIGEHDSLQLMGISGFAPKDPMSFEERISANQSSAIFGVDNSVLAMGMLCKKYLQMFGVKNIALTGSTGKTTTKELIARILEDAAPTLKTQANENNLIGVCKTILRILPVHEYAIFELGTNHFGEIAAMAEVVNPECGMILNIGPSHLEYFKDEEGVFKEKTDLFKRPLALRLFPADDIRFTRCKEKGIGIGFAEDSNYRISDIQSNSENSSQEGDSTSFILTINKSSNGHIFMREGSEFTWQIPYSAPHFVINAAFAIALAMELGLDTKDIQQSLFQQVKFDMRSQVEHLGSGLLIVDCYNANPCSMQNALEYWAKLLPDNPHIAILGDMLELGDSSTMYHRMISAMLAECNCQQLITVGDYSRLYHLAFSDENQEPSITEPSCHYEKVESLIESKYLCNLPNDAIIVVKGSHGIHLEKLLPQLRGNC